MIEITDVKGYRHYLDTKAIAHITETGVSSRWHGINAVVRTFDGRVIEAREEASDIAKLVYCSEA